MIGLKRIVCFLAVLIAFSQNAGAQGIPIITNYYPNTYRGHAQNFYISQDELGRMYFGNNGSMLCYDGSKWSGLEVEEIQTFWSVEVSKDGMIYVGGVGNFGYLEPDKKGILKYVSLVSKIKKEDRNFKEVWSIHPTKKGVIFFANDGIYNYENGEMIVTKPINDKGFHKFYKVGNKFFVKNRGVGLLEYKNRSLVFLPNSEKFSDVPIDFIVNTNENYLIGTRSDGLFFYNIYNQDLKPFVGALNDSLKKSRIYNAVKLKNGDIAIATQNNGIFFIDANLNLKEHINRRKNLIDNKVWYIYEDIDKNVWAATEKGISMIEYSSPFRIINENNNINGLVNASSKYKNEFLIATTTKLYKENQSRYEDLKTGAFNCFYNYKNNKNNILLIGGALGLFAYQNNVIKTIDSDETKFDIFYLKQSKFNKEIVFAGGSDFVAIYKLQNNTFKQTNYAEISGEVRSIEEDEYGNVYLGIEKSGIHYFNVSKTKKENFTSDIKKIESTFLEKRKQYSRFFLSLFKNKVICGTDSGLYEMVVDSKNPTKNTFKELENIKENFQNKKREIFTIYNDESDNLWIETHLNQIRDIGYIQNKSWGKYEFDNYYFNVFRKAQINSFFVIPKVACFLSSNDGLIKYDLSKKLPKFKNFNVVFERVLDSRNREIFGGYFYTKIKGINRISASQTDNLDFRIDYENNGITFEFASTTFNNCDEVMYKTTLVNYENKFTDWTEKNSRSFTNLNEGDYQFIVYAKDVHGNISNSAKFKFTVNTPWYKTIWAYTIFILFGFGIVIVIVKVYSQRLRNQNIHLEKVVKERTVEIEKQKHHIEEINKEVTDSINYAKILQENVMPSLLTAKELLPESFIFFKPRDIVSGDFFWMSKSPKNTIHLVVADCTGHGVPGAFMSMLGIEKLWAVTQNPINNSPSKILAQVNMEMKRTLKQTGEMNVKDGMELAFCEVDLDKHTLFYSGANRPILIFRDGKLIINEKPTKAGIGGTTEFDQVFDEKFFQLQKNDTIYLFSDGAVDQFGGVKSKKLFSAGFIKVLESIQHLALEEQNKYLVNFYKEWQGDLFQVDDIVVVGVRI